MFASAERIRGSIHRSLEKAQGLSTRTYTVSTYNWERLSTALGTINTLSTSQQQFSGEYRDALRSA